MIAPSYGAITVWRSYINPGVFAFSKVCKPSGFYPDRIQYGMVEVNRNEPWFSESGDTPPGQADFLGTMVHEFGHTFDFIGSHCQEPPGLCPGITDPEPGSAAPSMCGLTDYGWDYLSSTASHDRTAINAGYRACLLCAQ